MHGAESRSFMTSTREAFMKTCISMARLGGIAAGAATLYLLDGLPLAGVNDGIDNLDSSMLDRPNEFTSNWSIDSVT